VAFGHAAVANSEERSAAEKRPGGRVAL